MDETPSQAEFLSLEPDLRRHVVVMPTADVERLKVGSQPLTRKWRRFALGAVGLGGGAGGGAATAAQLAARAAAGAASGAAAGPFIVAGGAAGLAVALLLDRRPGVPAGVTLI